jgi:hypothetical protein
MYVYRIVFLETWPNFILISILSMFYTIPIYSHPLPSLRQPCDSTIKSVAGHGRQTCEGLVMGNGWRIRRLVILGKGLGVGVPRA